MNMNTEPIRLPAWLYAIILVVGPPLASILVGGDARQAIAVALLGLVAGGGVIARAESIRARTDSPATIHAQYEAAKAILDAHDAEARRVLDEHDLERG